MTACPICLGVFPGEGPDQWVCRCGTAWATGDSARAHTDGHLCKLILIKDVTHA